MVFTPCESALGLLWIVKFVNALSIIIITGYPTGDSHNNSFASNS